MQEFYGNIIDIFNQNIFYGKLLVEDTKIHSVEQISDTVLADASYILPGFIDSHIHIESSLLTPSQFARMAVLHGTIATVSDPHEIANVCGVPGVQYMIDDAATTNFYFFFGAPSCVPATIYETAGAAISPSDTKLLLQQNDIWYLSEMMNFPGVLYNDASVYQKIEAAIEIGKPIDGHAPGLRGADTKKYIYAGRESITISTDHECFTMEEALDKLHHGMKIIIREGSAARNFDALIPLLHDYPNQMMFCSDDKHPDSLLEGHINLLCKRAVAVGIDLFKVLRAACIIPALHYSLPVGLLRPNDSADFIIINNPVSFDIQQVFIKGVCVAQDGISLLSSPKADTINRFAHIVFAKNQLRYVVSTAPISEKKLPIIVAEDGQLITGVEWISPNIQNGEIITDPDQDILKLVVVNRYASKAPSIALVKNFGLRHAALASTVAHDSHNIVAVGTDDDTLFAAIDAVIQSRGGLSHACVENEKMVTTILPLPVAGLMSNEDAWQVAEAYIHLDQKAKASGSKLRAPFMTLSFMALLVIPHIKLSDKGLFDGDRFCFY